MPVTRQVTINFDNGVQKVQGSYNGSGIVSDWTESGQSIQVVQGNTIFTITLKPGYVVNSVVSTTSGEITFTDNTFSQSSSFSDTITITTSKVEINTALQNNNETLEQTNTKLTSIKNTLNSKGSGGSGGSKVDTSDADATQSDILSGKTAYVNGTKLTGTHVCETPQTQEKTATPSTSIQEITPDSGKYLSKVTVGAIPNSYINLTGLTLTTNQIQLEDGLPSQYASIYINTPINKPRIIVDQDNVIDLQNDGNTIIFAGSNYTLQGLENLTAGNVKSGVNIGGVTGTYEGASAPVEETKTVDLSMATGNQVFTPTSGKTLSQVTITKPSTLTPGNIKKDIDIGGVIGTYEAITPTVTFDSTTGTLTITTSEASS